LKSDLSGTTLPDRPDNDPAIANVVFPGQTKGQKCRRVAAKTGQTTHGIRK
jgi:hypothetical protein